MALNMKQYRLVLIGVVLFPILMAAVVEAADDKLEGELEPFLGEPEFEVQQVFTGERFPNVVVTLDGTVLATWGSKSFKVRRSEDGGRTWGEEIIVADLGFHGGGVLVDENTGDALVFVDNDPPAPRHVYRSHDQGRSWKREDVVFHEDTKGNIPSLHMSEHGITLRHGNHAGRLLRPARVYGKVYARGGYNTAIYSDDSGKTWHPSEPFPAYGTGEGAIAELADGRIYYNSRRHHSTDGLNPRRRHIAFSHDGGQTWEDLSVSEVLPDGDQNRDYGLMGGLVRLPVRGRDILIFSNIESPKGRTGGTVWASFDGGNTWPVKRLVEEGRFAYSSLSAGRPGTSSEGWIYLQFEEGEGGGHMARFNLSWLLQGLTTGDGDVPKLK